jgi:hypothetical protein
LDLGGLSLQETVSSKVVKVPRGMPLGDCVANACRLLRVDRTAFVALYRGHAVLDTQSPADMHMPESCDAFLVEKKWLAYQRREVRVRVAVVTLLV